jgi:acyl-CoA reductase-like NAD-dependent aldehyde dehydrogenase
MSLETISTISPTTNKPIIVRNGISPSELDSLPTIATEAFETFKKTTLAERKEIVKRALKLLNDKKDKLSKELTEQMGRPIAYTAKEITTACNRGEYLLKICEEVLEDTGGETEKGLKKFIRKIPVGPVLVLFAWNVGLSQNSI